MSDDPVITNIAISDNDLDSIMTVVDQIITLATGCEYGIAMVVVGNQSTDGTAQLVSNVNKGELVTIFKTMIDQLEQAPDRKSGPEH